MNASLRPNIPALRKQRSSEHQNVPTDSPDALAQWEPAPHQLLRPDAKRAAVSSGGAAPSDRTRGNGHKLKPRKLQLNRRKNFFPLRVMEPWPRLPREAVESPSLEIFQTRLDTVLCSLLWVTLLGQRVGLGDPQRSLPTPTILWFCELDGVRSISIHKPKGHGQRLWAQTSL